MLRWILLGVFQVVGLEFGFMLIINKLRIY